MIQLVLVENNYKDFEKAMDAEMTKVIKHFEKELIGIRTGRAHTSLIEDVPVSVYGANPAPLKHLAVLNVVDARMITVTPWDAATINDIEKALSANAGLTTQNDGKMIRIQLPEMSSQRREELVKVLHKKLEECRVGLRNVRTAFKELVRDTEKNKKISKDFASRLSDILETITKKFVESAETMSEKKEKDIKTV